MGQGMVVNCEHLFKEIGRLSEGGIAISPANLKISEGATICTPMDVDQDGLEEDRLAGKKFGSTRRGIAPVYAAKYMKKALKMGDLLHRDYLLSRVETLVDWKNIVMSAYGVTYTVDGIMEWLDTYAMPLAKYVCDTGAYLYEANANGKRIMLEAQLGALRDIDFGIYPYTTSSSTITAYGPIGAGVPGLKVDNSIGIMKAYSSCVGEGPFTAELFGEKAHELREAGGEYGAATGRPRRVGGFDVVASRYGCRVQAADEVALTKLDILDTLAEIPVTVSYDVEGKTVSEFPYGEALNIATPNVIFLPGWQSPTTECRTFSDLPKNAQDYVLFIEAQVGCKIKYISVGAERSQIIVR
jgi:adenylosuccinate synthase